MAVLLSAAIASAHAETSDVDEAYAQGIAAFRLKQYAVAATRFEAALALGGRSGRIYYNLGSAYYQLGRLSEAEDSYRQAARFPDTQAMSWYNLGLVSMQRRDWLAAADWFSKVMTSTAPENLKALSPIALGRVQQEIERALRMHLQVNAGHNSSVLGPSDLAPSRYSGQGAGFFDVHAGYGSGRRGFYGNYAQALISLYTTQYSGMSGANVSAASGALAMERPDAHGRWDVSFGAGKLWYGGDDYHFAKQVSGSRVLNWRAFEGQVAYEFARIKGLAVPDPGLTGSRRKVILGAAYRVDRSRFSASYGRETDSRAAIKLSSVRNEYRASWTYNWPQGDSFTLQYAQRISAYPGWGAFTREDTLNEGNAEYLHRWGAGVYSTATLRHTSNSSNDPVFSYSQNIMFVGVGCEI